MCGNKWVFIFGQASKKKKKKSLNFTIFSEK